MTSFTPLTAYPPLTVEDFELQYDADHKYSFFEDEDGGTYYTYGHDRDAEFAVEATEYQMYAGGMNREDSLCHADEVYHYWAVTVDPDEGAFTWHGVTEDTPNAFPVSVIYR